jgi:hypothetical protein
MTEAHEGERSGARLAEVWRDRPLMYSRPLWLIALALDLLPYPWGEEILARFFWIAGLIRPARRRPAFAWAAALIGRRSWRLGLAACAFRGRWVARSMLIGVRGPRELARRVVVHGGDHLADASGRGTILLGPITRLGECGVARVPRSARHADAARGANPVLGGLPPPRPAPAARRPDALHHGGLMGRS